MRNVRKFSAAKKNLTIISLIFVIVFGFELGFSQKVPDKIRTAQSQINKPLSPRQIVDKVLPSLVVIFAQDKQGKTIGQGSGFLYKPGLIVTNLHVFTRASSGFVKVANSEKRYNINAIVGIDSRHDICVFQIDDRTIPQLTISNFDKTEVGDEVYAFGNPKGLEGSVSKGIVSSIRNNLGLMQIDAAISPGSSGGPIVNQQAEVVGIAVSTLTSGQNLNFSVPVKYLLALKERFNFPVSNAGILSVSDRDNENLKGLVKSYSQEYAEFNYDEKNDKYIEETIKKMVVNKVFDVYGNLLEEKNYQDGKFTWKYTYSYGDDGFMTKRNYEDYNGERDSWEDPIDKIISLRSTHLSGTFNASTGDSFVYDSSGNLTESAIQLNTGLMRTAYIYDRNGFETDSKEYLNEKLSKARRYTYDFDRYGNWIKRYLTVYDSRWASIGYVPTSVIYRDIKYFEN